MQPDEDDLKTEFKGEKFQIGVGHDIDGVTWIKVGNDKRIERPQKYSDNEDFYLAISTQSSNPIHLIDRETQQTYCGEELEEITTDDNGLNDDDPVSRRGICSGCLNEDEDF